MGMEKWKPWILIILVHHIFRRSVFPDQIMSNFKLCHLSVPSNYEQVSCACEINYRPKKHLLSLVLPWIISHILQWSELTILLIYKRLMGRGYFKFCFKSYFSLYLIYNWYNGSAKIPCIRQSLRTEFSSKIPFFFFYMVWTLHIKMYKSLLIFSRQAL